jgi:hypothetical protein
MGACADYESNASLIKQTHSEYVENRNDVLSTLWPVIEEDISRISNNPALRDVYSCVMRTGPPTFAPVSEALDFCHQSQACSTDPSLQSQIGDVLKLLQAFSLQTWNWLQLPRLLELVSGDLRDIGPELSRIRARTAEIGPTVIERRYGEMLQKKQAAFTERARARYEPILKRARELHRLRAEVDARRQQIRELENDSIEQEVLGRPLNDPEVDKLEREVLDLRTEIEQFLGIAERAREKRRRGRKLRRDVSVANERRLCEVQGLLQIGRRMQQHFGETLARIQPGRAVEPTRDTGRTMLAALAAFAQSYA